jgi:hypothetical protein
MMLTVGAAIAGGGYTSGVVGHAQTDWQKEAFYDGCMNGDVSSTGLFSSQREEDKATARMAISAQSAS